MARLSFNNMFILFLVVFSVVTIVAHQAEAQKRCEVILDPNNCELSSCRQQCYQQKQGNVSCQEMGAGSGSYRCVCYYNC
ncbi:hypothetical protein MKX01_003014 [Papaver californicum]|nr:hypothetical protein MKX01_003014 [Papaver californicum]